MYLLEMVYFQFCQHCETAKQAFQWTSEVQVTFQTLIEALCTAHILAYLQLGERFVIDIIVSNVSIGRVLSHRQE
jgi:hypothetical protein